MKRFFVTFGLLVALIPAGEAMAAGASQADFSGTWVLDQSSSQEVGRRVQNYKMVVAQDARQLKVQSDVEHNLRSDDDSTGGSRGGGYPGGGGGYPGGGSRRGGGFPTGIGFPGGGLGGRFPGGGIPGIPGGRGSRGGQRSGGNLALRTVIPNATYNLDGTETSAQVDGPNPGTATFKADWKKDGRMLELSTSQNVEDRSETINSKERWELSSDGTQLKVQRSVKSPRGNDSVKLTFVRQRQDQQTGEASSQSHLRAEERQ